MPPNESPEREKERTQSHDNTVWQAATAGINQELKTLMDCRG